MHRKLDDNHGMECTHQQTNIDTLEPSRKICKNHLASDIIGDPKVNALTHGAPKANYKEMIGLFISCHNLTIEPKNYTDAFNDEF